MIDLPIMRNHQSPPPSPPPDSIFKRDALAACSPPTPTSSTTAATPGTASPISLGPSCPSASATGPMHDPQCGLVLFRESYVLLCPHIQTDDDHGHKHSHRGQRHRAVAVRDGL